MPTDEHRTGAPALDATAFLRESLPADLISARWMPVYVEPIQFSGERITLCIAAVPDGLGAPVVRTTLAVAAVEKVLGAIGKQLTALADRLANDLGSHLISGGALQAWRPPYAGVFAGEVTHGDGANLRAIISSAMHCTSIFSAGLEPGSARNHDAGLDFFKDQIKSAVLAERKFIGDRFDLQTKILGGAVKASFDYVGTDLAINLGKLDTSISSHSQQRDALLRRLNQLVALREDDRSIARKISSLMLGVWTPAKQMSAKEEDAFGAYTTEIEFAANRSGVTYLLANEDADPSEIITPFVSKILADI